MTDMTDSVSGLLRDEPQDDAQSLLTQLRQKRRELEQGVWLDVPIPGYDGKLVARFDKVSPEDLEVLGARMRGSRDIDERLDVASDAIVERCQQVCMKSPKGVYYQLSDDRPLRFEAALGTKLDLDGAASMTARQTLYALLGNRGESGILGMMRQLMDWSAGVSEETRETLAGEPRAIRP